MPAFIKNTDGSIIVRIYYKDLSTEAIEEIDKGLGEFDRGILYDHIIEEFGVATIDIPAPDKEVI